MAGTFLPGVKARPNRSTPVRVKLVHSDRLEKPGRSEIESLWKNRTIRAGKIGGSVRVKLVHLMYDASDGNRLTGLSDSRATSITSAIGDLARFTAVLLAHECGHSMGLVQDGAMPVGLYGGDSVNFPGSLDGHLVMPSSIFPGNSINIMTPMISYSNSLDSSTGFNTLNLAYLREVAIYN